MRLALLACLLASTMSDALAQAAWNYPPAPRGDTVDNYHGTRVADPYRWLEDLDSKETRSWVESENKITFGFLGSLPERAYFHQRLQALWNFPRVRVPFKEGGRYFHSRNDGLQNQDVLYVQETLSSPPRLLLDPNSLRADGTVAVTATNVSPDGRWLAYNVAAAGSDWNEIRVRSVDTGADSADLVRWVKFSEAAWTKDSRGFFYSRYPAPPTNESGAETFRALEHQRVYYHQLGTPQSSDRLIYERADDPKLFLGTSTTEDGRYLLITTMRGSMPENLLAYVDLRDPLRPDVSGKIQPIVTEWNGEYRLIGNDGPVLYFLTTMGAPKRRLIAIDLRAPTAANWKTVIAESADTIESILWAGGRFVVKSLHDATNRLTIVSEDGRERHDIALPGLGTVSAMSGRGDDSEMFFNFVSFNTPATNFRYDVATKRAEVLGTPAVGFNPDDYVTEQMFYRSKDGTRVPLFISHRRGLPVGPDTPALLYGYGGFDIAETPAFSVSRLVWMEAGGLFAQACLRGGGEYGREWHEAGTKERKQNVFDDFIAAAEWLIAHRYTSRARLVLDGRSNGGLLIGATLNQRPDLCRVAWAEVGVMDMLRYHKFTVGYAWAGDYGTSDDPAGFKYLSAYSPVHTIRPGAKYPAILVTTADHDDRVYPAHSFKYTAALQAAAANTPDSGPILIRIETRAGHGVGRPTAKLIDEDTDKMAFAARFLDWKLPAQPAPWSN